MPLRVRLFSLLIALVVALVPLLAVPVAAQEPIAFASFGPTAVGRPGQAVQVRGIFGEGGLLLIDPLDLGDSPATRDLLIGHAAGISRLYIAGGTAAVSDEVVAQALAAIGG